MSDSGLANEAYKLMISDIAKAREIHTNVFQVQLSLEDKGRVLPLTVKLVWIQGNVTHIRHDPEDSTRIIVMNDGTGEALVGGCDVIPGGDHHGIRIGGYIGVLGQILSTKPDIEIKAVKIMWLGEKPLLKTMWPDEVKDLKAFLILKPEFD